MMIKKPIKTVCPGICRFIYEGSRLWRLGTGVRPKDLKFYIYPMMSAKVNPNNDNVSLHKGSLFPTLAQTKVPMEIQTLEGR